MSEESLHSQILDESIEIEKPDDCNVSTEVVLDDSSSSKVEIITSQPETTIDIGWLSRRIVTNKWLGGIDCIEDILVRDHRPTSSAHIESSIKKGENHFWTFIIMRSFENLTDDLCTSRLGILFIMVLSLILSFLMLKLRDYILGPDLGMDRNVHKVDFERILLEIQESNLRQIQKEDWKKK